MRFQEMDMAGAWLIDADLVGDDRGAFARTWCQTEFGDRGIDAPMVQSSISVNHRRGTLRGMHFQRPPSREDKLVRCTHGSVCDVIVDVRRDSPTYLQHAAVELSAANMRSIYIPPGFAHGFQTLEDDSIVFYMMNDFYQPETAGGARWNDPAFSIEWPIEQPTCMSDRDRDWPDFDADSFTDFDGY